MRLLIPLFSPATGTWGGLTRVIALAEAAKNSGHQVAFCASGYLESALRKHGYLVYSTTPTTMFGLPPALSRTLEKRSQRASIPVKPGKSVGSIWLVLALSGLARSGYLRHLVTEEINAAQDFRADRIFTDLDPAAFLTSAVSGLPIASAYASIATTGRGTFFWKLMQRAINPILRSYEKPAMTPDELFFGNSVLKIIPSIPDLDEPDPERRDVLYVGQLIGAIRSSSPDDFQIEEGRRYVFVYTGTGSISLDVLEDTLPQLFPQDSEATCMVGVQSIEYPYRLGGVTFRSYVPADALLPHCDWTICHGGQNTIIHSLLYGVPLLIFPGPIFERRYNARKVMQAGAGLMGEVNEFTPEWLRVAFEKRATLASQAAVLSQRIRSYGGAGVAVEAIAAWEG